ncbi:ATP-dependent dethiobiotin synthetase BioD [Rhizobium sp. 16-449-1b]|uniref:dethiobiotin synthase n=1 Tax=Rhizobium sp. 16-449-1b TaxID=2819989 RepID=UPI001ADAFFFD|nr:dethiobiotin synthase [Rhizobium sp. 16-449-1b]MBO9195395.1 ATP-dependent dethiobiotin synthetase BioD [Rhizobium sp. 16-449-1b]
MSTRFVVTGTDTGIGKTIFSAALTAALGAIYWKPVQSGLDEETDSEVVTRLGGISQSRILPEAYRLVTPASPHLAASLDGILIDPARLVPPDLLAPLIIEGAGGLLVPLSDDLVFADIFARWQIPAILCARTTLGTINHTLLSVEAMRHRGIPIFGIAFIGEENQETQRIIASMSGTRILGRLPWMAEISAEGLQQAFGANFDIAVFKEGAR